MDTNMRKRIDILSEKPNNCEDEDIYEYCPRCGMRMLSKWYKAKDEPTISKMEQVDEPQTQGE